jgi:hypothetical protein
LATGGVDVLGGATVVVVVAAAGDELVEVSGGGLDEEDPGVGLPVSWSAPPQEDMSAARTPATAMGAQAAGRRSTALTMPHRRRD